MSIRKEIGFEVMICDKLSERGRLCDKKDVANYHREMSRNSAGVTRKIDVRNVGLEAV